VLAALEPVRLADRAIGLGFPHQSFQGEEKSHFADPELPAAAQLADFLEHGSQPAPSFTPARTSAAQPKQQRLADLGVERSLRSHLCGSQDRLSFL